ncbi:DgyrCDS9827 [Dimorphilus gyrociliatus]|uniref:DgyrCDS9827 n=1 Tax=Dimorphilus gyrociliatus TaxID=2664684 RepID=A0A7I8VYI3_9ANNE|nr:DgyrCDS9827 [Dimorphilus gyrociliatus]
MKRQLLKFAEMYNFRRKKFQLKPFSNKNPPPNGSSYDSHIEKVKFYTRKYLSNTPEKILPSLKKSTQNYKDNKHLIDNHVTFNENSSILTKIPYSTVVLPEYKALGVDCNAAQFEYLLKTIYRPHNQYCIHVDKKSKQPFWSAILNIAKCFDNIEVIDEKEAVDVKWGFYSVLEPEIICMKNLWKRKTKWKYLINLTAQEFPLQTMQDLIKILKSLKGANSLEGTVARRNVERTEKDINMKPKIPFNKGITIAKGAVYLVVQRGFETYFPSLNHSPQLHIPGSYTGNPETDPVTYLFIGRFKNWGGYPFDYPCAGKRVRGICILSIGDLSLLANRKELFANKFHLDYQPFALQCMRELIYNRTRDELAGKREIDLSYYENLKMVKYHIGSSL